MKNFFIVLLLTVLFCNCTNKYQVKKQLDLIESQISINPQKAKQMLDSIPQSDYSSITLQARYILLDTYCNYRLRQVGDNDSLINLAEQVLLQDGSQHDKMLCLFLHGVILNFSLQRGEAMLKFKAAAVEGEHSEDHFLLGQIYSHMVLLCAKVFDPDELKYAERALEEYKKYGDESYILDAEASVAAAHMQKDSYEDCILLLEKVLEKAVAQADTFDIIKCVYYIAGCEFRLGQYDSALTHYMQLKYDYHKILTYHETAHCAAIFASRLQADSALLYLEESIRLTPQNERSLCYLEYIKSKVYKYLGDYEKAYDALSLHNEQEVAYYQDRLSQTVMKEQRDFVEERLSQTAERNKKLYALLSISTIVILLVVLSFYLYSKQKKVELQLHKEKASLQAEKAQRLVLEMKLKEENQKNIIQTLKLSEPVIQLRKSLTSLQSVRDQDWKNLYAEFNNLLPSFEQVLKSHYPLSESELQVCMLIKLEFSPGDISILTNKTKASISATRTRLYYKLFQKEGTAKDLDDYIRSI